MAHVTITGSQSDHGFISILSAPFRAIGRFYEHMMNSNPRARQAEFLMSLDDEQLAKRGLRREDIVRHVYRDLFYV